MEDYEYELSQYDQAYEEANPEEFDSPPDGKYQVVIDSVRLGKSQLGSTLLKFDMIVLSGPQANRHIFHNMVINTNTISFLKRDLIRLGLPLMKISDLPNNLEAMLDIAMEITKKTNGDYNNIYFNKRISVPVPPREERRSAGNNQNDEIPF